MKLRIYCNDSEIPMQVIDVTEVERVMPDGSIRQMKAAVEPLQFTHDPAADWTTIDPADPGTLPQTMGIVLLSITDGYNEATLPGYRGDMPGEFYSWTGEKIAPGTDITVYAYQILPEPAPLPGGVQE